MKKFESMEKAWSYVKLSYGKFEKDENSTEREGYAVYRNVDDPAFYICDLNERLKLNYANGKIENCWIDKYANIRFFVEAVQTGFVREFEYHDELIQEIRFWWSGGVKFDNGIEDKIEKTIEYLLSIDDYSTMVEFEYSGLKFTIKHV